MNYNAFEVVFVLHIQIKKLKDEKYIIVVGRLIDAVESVEMWNLIGIMLSCGHLLSSNFSLNILRRIKPF